ncbi:Ankyrin repeat-containing protein [Paenibacillus sp. yr247]|uniref:ankyrin repeat domain-containing protein n=1 Tax=Paenibacillus sp. yr247 TaxID=1761880 RepID=UPI000890E813|nr:ankyrin repeat domain-containing protein [Paenibacillus sp. yr247]SDP24652.1 Ankyrin repeat-containing protein [Paenibacillus sp. yr247]
MNVISHEQLEKLLKHGETLEFRKALKLGLNPNTIIKYSPLIRLATYYNQPQIVQELLLAGANPDTSDTKRGMTALIDAAYKGYKDIVDILIPFTKNINFAETVFGNTALMEASRGGELDIVKLLVGNGSDKNIVNKNRETALDLAIQKGFEDIVSFLK